MRQARSFFVLSQTGTPPGSPAQADAYFVTTGSGAWTGKSNIVAVYRGSEWQYIALQEGDLVYDDGTTALLQWTGATLSAMGSSAADLAAGTGVAALSPSQITADQNDYAPSGHGTAAMFRLSSDAERTITGLSGGAAGRVVRLFNIGSNPIRLADDSASSTAANRFDLRADIVIDAGISVSLQYDGTSSRWRVATDGAAAAFAESDLDLQMFGDGSDGDVTINSGTTALTRDMFYNNLTINGTGRLNPAGYRVYVRGVLDLTAAPAGAISYTQGNGGAGAAGGTAGTAGSNSSTASLGGTGAGTAGGAGGTAAGSQATAPTNQSPANGGAGGLGALGGDGTGGGGGASRAGATVSNALDLRTFERHVIRGITLLLGGAGGAGGGGGGGDGTSGGGGGGGGAGGGVVWLAARTISRGGSTAAGAIRALGGDGGAGGRPAAGNRGGGRGGGGGGGGQIYIGFRHLIGSSATDAVDASGGAGGAPGVRSGSGTTNGTGGTGGTGGRIRLYNLRAGTVSGTDGSAGTAGTTTTAGAAGPSKSAL